MVSYNKFSKKEEDCFMTMCKYTAYKILSDYHAYLFNSIWNSNRLFLKGSNTQAFKHKFWILDQHDSIIVQAQKLENSGNNFYND